MPGAETNHNCVKGICLEQEPITFVSGAYARSRNQSHLCRGLYTWSRNQSHLCWGYIPGARTNDMRGGGVYLALYPGLVLQRLLLTGQCHAALCLLIGQSRLRCRQLFRCRLQEPISSEEGVYSRTGTQSCQWRGYIPTVVSNRVRGDGMYLEWEPIA